MRSFVGLLNAERLKLGKSFIWLLVPISPLLALLFGVLANLDSYSGDGAIAQYQVMISLMSMMHAMLFLPLLTGIFSAFVCRYEHAGGGWKQVLALPVSRTGLYAAKLAMVAALLVITQLLFLVSVLAAAKYQGIEGAIPWAMLLKSTIGGLFACLPLAALQMLVSVGWSSFAAPLVINVMLTLPNMLVVNSEQFAPFYPWAQPLLAMLVFDQTDMNALSLPWENVLITVIGSSVLFLAAGLIYFNRKEI
jgi:hypothetical protein